MFNYVTQNTHSYRYEAMYGRLKKIAELAHEKKVRLMIDAEQTYFQHAIDSMVLRLQRRFNKDHCVVYNTYQCYLMIRAYD